MTVIMDSLEQCYCMNLILEVKTKLTLVLLQMIVVVKDEINKRFEEVDTSSTPVIDKK